MEQINSYIKDNIDTKLCKANYCLGSKAIKNFNGYCEHCFVNLFTDDPITLQIKSKTKEQVVRKFINIHFDGFSHNKSLWTNNCECIHRRKIDHRKLIGNTLLCIETDEFQHKYYKKSDEELRYDDLAMIHGGKFIFIRFNPDKFINHIGKKKNTILYIRLNNLKNEIIKQINRINNDENKNLLEIIYLYYDGYNENISENENDYFNIIELNNHSKNYKNKINYQKLINNNDLIINNLNKINNNCYDKFMCFHCFYSTNKIYNIILHFSKKNKCSRNSICIFPNNIIYLLNIKQLEYSKNTENFYKLLNIIIKYILNNLNEIKNIYLPHYNYICFKCFSGFSDKFYLNNHFNQENNCIKNPSCMLSKNEIDYYNINQINNVDECLSLYNKNNYKYFENLNNYFYEDNSISFNINLIENKKIKLYFKKYNFDNLNRFKFNNDNNDKIFNTSNKKCKYKCYKCNQNFHKKYNIQMHLKRKIPCIKDKNNCMSDTEIDILNISQFDKKENNKNNTNNTYNTNHKNTNSEEEVDDMLKYFAYLYKENPDKSINFLKSYCNSLIFRFHGNYVGY